MPDVSAGDVIAVAVWAFITGWLIRQHVDQRVAARKGARLAPHYRRGRVPCANPSCTRMMWTDHAWQAATGPLLYCSPQCVPHQEGNPTS